MTKFRIQWSFVDPAQALKVVDALGSKSLDYINFYSKNKKIDQYNRMICYNREIADKETKKYIRKFFKENEGNQPFCEFIRK